MSHLEPGPGFDPGDFIDNYWQQKPLVIENFFSDFSDLTSAGELAGLSLDEGVDSRLVTLHDSQYQLRWGPFHENDFQRLENAENWTLLVQAVDQFIPALARLRRAFNFLPHWRIDDVMVSWATPGGSVGPHFDHYDVFLLQGEGQRSWSLGQHCQDEDLVNSDSGLKLLSNFEKKQEVTLTSGDILYIPAGVAHWGIARQSGLCYSIGFRAPSLAELAEILSDLAIDQYSPFQRYQDQAALLPASGAEIQTQGLQQLWHALRASLDQPQLLYRGFGMLVTRPRYPELIMDTATTADGSVLAVTQNSPERLQLNPHSRLAWMRPEASASVCLLFADGEVFEQPISNLNAVKSLCEPSAEHLYEKHDVGDEKSWQNLLIALLQQGSLLST